MVSGDQSASKKMLTQRFLTYVDRMCYAVSDVCLMQLAFLLLDFFASTSLYALNDYNVLFRETTCSETEEQNYEQQ